MKFGLESEKFLFDLKNNKPSNGVFRFIDALIDFDPHSLRNITNEFVLNMVEIVTAASETPTDVLKNYLLDYVMFNSIAKRESVTMVGLGSLPLDFLPHMTPKWAYFVQNSILAGQLQSSWMMTKETPLTPAGNCAGIHIHSEIETPPEFLYSTRELQDKFNLSLMLSPMIAFSSSPYFFGKHDAASMRAQRYYFELYRDYPLNGNLPPVMNSSHEVLSYFKLGTEKWIERGIEVGLPEEDLSQLIKKKGASWNPVRWNRTWNTIEFRCLDSDRVDLDCSKFIWVTGAMKRTDVKGEALKCEIMEGELSETLIQKCFKVSDGNISILSTEAIQDLFRRAVTSGLSDEFVRKYLLRLGSFAESGIQEDSKEIFNILKTILEGQSKTTADNILGYAGNAGEISQKDSIEVLKLVVESEKKVLKSFIQNFPDMALQFSKFLN